MTKISGNMEIVISEKNAVVHHINSIETKAIEENINVNAITGDRNYLLYRLKEAFSKAKRVDIIVSFLMESGVKIIKKELESLLKRNVEINILTGNYLNITEPGALYLLKDILGDKVRLKFYNVENKSFHPKAYFFHYENGEAEVFVGSSNLSRSALTKGIEWNYRLRESSNEADFKFFYNTYRDLFDNHSIEVTEEVMKNYSKTWKATKIFKQTMISNEEDKYGKIEGNNNVLELFEPRGAQIEALYALKKARDEGLDKVIIIAATGIGKTYLSAFDSKDYNRILFVAHREEILKQAATSFRNVRGNDSIGFFYSTNKETDKEVIFALVQTLGKEEYLNENYFASDAFDYIVVDEFHHAVAGNYKRIMDYFKPKFLLGLTATPERLDNKDVFALCDYNVVYEIRLKEAINKDLLVPFRYYGIYDETVNYQEIDFKNGKYDAAKLEEALMINRRADLILKHYLKHNSKVAMGFCASKNHAEYMAKYFNENNVPAAAVYSSVNGDYSIEREEALSKLNKGEIKIIFSVDMFNEGLDVPAIDLVMFLRPTESPTVFLQQLGRGLRKYRDKKYLIVLDFIGNFKKANLVPFLLSSKQYDKTESKNRNPQQFEYPEDCIVDFDFQLIDIFKKMAEKEMSIKDLVKEEFYRIREDLGHRPSRVEFITYIDDDIYFNVKDKKALNPFKDYLSYLNDLGELNEEELSWFNSRGSDFIKMVENTIMSKTYKMPLLLAFYNNGNMKLKINEEDIYKSFKDFYSKGSNKVDMLKDKNTRDFESWNSKEYNDLAKKNPRAALLKTHREFFYNDNEKICIMSDIERFTDIQSFVDHFKDSVEYRVMEYYKNRGEK
ncbi:DEAD/DEAH box helicase family protein [Clostridium sp. SYSU_GA19001]|nr:DEAD/DEAH box helicase family protein [Clostridium caldaquaticum]MCM8712122.1 DEAD/DEAH box helicase family protein [Clostridium caldaquaticum]